jgi:cytolysin-activating lysine-acyltransferase
MTQWGRANNGPEVHHLAPKAVRKHELIERLSNATIWNHESAIYNKIALPTDPDIAATMGQAVWLMTMTDQHRDLPIHEVEARVAVPILLRRFKLYSKGKQPVAFLTWATVSDAVKAKVEAGGLLELAEWTSGDTLLVVDVVSPFNPAEVFVERFLKGGKNMQRGKE